MGILSAMAAMLIISSAFEIVPIDPSKDRAYALGPLIILAVAVFWLAYVFLKIPTRIDVADNGSITFRSPVRTISLEPNQITRLTCNSDGDWILQKRRESWIFATSNTTS